MKMDDIMDIIESLAHSQGYYGRLLEAISMLNEEQFNDLKDEWEGMNFKEPVDFIMFLEG